MSPSSCAGGASRCSERVGDSQAIEARLGRLYGLLRKYGETEQELLEYAARARAEADRLRGTEAERARRAGRRRPAGGGRARRGGRAARRPGADRGPAGHGR